MRTVLDPNRDWLLGLSWVARSERVLVVVIIACAVIAGAAAGVAATWIAGVAGGTGHLLLLLPAVVIPRRRLSFTVLGLLALSAVNLLVAALARFPALELIALVYGGLGILGLSPALGIAGRRLRQWGRVADCSARDDFRWLLTEAPLMLRWRFAGLLRRLYSDAWADGGTDSGAR